MSSQKLPVGPAKVMSSFARNSSKALKQYAIDGDADDSMEEMKERDSKCLFLERLLR